MPLAPKRAIPSAELLAMPHQLPRPPGFLPDGSVAVGDGYGILASEKDSHVWSTDLIINISDGTKIRSIGEMDLETLTWKGKNYPAE